MSTETVKKWPIVPEQLVTGRNRCPNCDNNTEKCGGCGIGSESFVRALLLEVFEKAGSWPLTLIDRVSCKCIQPATNIAEQSQDRFVKLCESDNYYYDKDSKETFYYFDLNTFFKETPCYERRTDKDFNACCVLQDLSVGADILSNRSTFKLESLSALNSKKEQISIPCYSYTCNRREDCSLTELAFPIYIFDKCVAVLITGQLSAEKNNGVHKKIDEIASYVADFKERLQERTIMRQKDFLYGYLDNLLKECSDKVDPEDLIKTIYDRLNKDFDYEQIVFLYSDEDAEKGFKTYPEDVEQELLRAILNDGSSSEEQETILGKDPEGKKIYKIYKKTSTSDPEKCWIKTYIRYNPNTPGNNVGEAFFNTLIALILSSITTKYAERKRISQDVLVKTFLHELNQRAEILENHSDKLETKRLSWKFPEDSLVISDVRDFVKDVKNLQNQIRHFAKDAAEDDPGFPNYSKKESFEPYGRFIFNLRENYSSEYGMSGKRLYVPSYFHVAQYAQDYPRMYADPVQIERCVNNLLSNAFKYSYVSTNVYLDCVREGNEYVIRVINFCAPLKDDIRENMFKWGTSQGASYKKPKGNGYGLAIVKHLCNLHEASIVFKQDTLSDYNIPLLVYALNNLKHRGNQTSDESLYGKSYVELNKEYKKLKKKIDVNRVAKINYCGNILEEVYCADQLQKLPDSFIKMGLCRPMARLTFEIRIPQSFT